MMKFFVERRPASEPECHHACDCQCHCQPGWWQDPALTIRNCIGNLRAAVAAGFASLLPEAMPVHSFANHLDDGIIWDKFLRRLVHIYHEHFMCILMDIVDFQSGSRRSELFWCQTTSVFSSLSADRLADPLAARQIYQNIVDKFVPHTTFPVQRKSTEHGDVLNDSKGTKPMDPKLVLRFFVPLLIWSYNGCKEGLYLLDARSESAVVERSSLFRYGSALDVRRHPMHSAELRGLLSSTSKPYEGVQNLEVCEARSTILNKFNTVMKCLAILTDDTLLDVLLTNDCAMQLFYNPSMSADNTTRTGTLLTEALETVCDDDVFGVAHEAIYEERLGEIEHCLFGSDVDYISSDKNGLILTERQIDDFVSKAVEDDSKSPAHWRDCRRPRWPASEIVDDYVVLLALLDNLHPRACDSESADIGVYIADAST